MTEDIDSQPSDWRLLEWLLVLAALVMLSATLWSLAGDTIRASVHEILNPPTPTRTPPVRPTRRPIGWHGGWQITPDVTLAVDGLEGPVWLLMGLIREDTGDG